MLALLVVGCGSPIGSVEPAEPCALQPCIAEQATTSIALANEGAALGYDLATDGRTVIAGAPSPFGAAASAAVHGFDAVDLEPTGAWTGGRDDLTGGAVAVADVGADGVLDVVVGRAYLDGEDDAGGRAHLLLGLPDDTDIEDAAVLTVVADTEPAVEGVSDALGFEMALGDVGGGDIEWVVSVPTAGELWVFDPTARGTVSSDDALRGMSGDDPVENLVAWDGDCDGVGDLVAGLPAEASWYAGPWQADRLQGDADASWGPGLSPGQRLDASGDLDGDGCVDLILGSPNHEAVDFRAGAAFVVTAGAPTSSTLGELPVVLLGDRPGEALGYSVASGDLDGDGADDLLVGAPSLHDGPEGGTVRLFLGPFAPSALAPDDADRVLHGELPGDFLGRRMVVVDSDGDTRDDLVVSASAAYGGGALYLVLGADWLP